LTDIELGTKKKTINMQKMQVERAHTETDDTSVDWLC